MEVVSRVDHCIVVAHMPKGLSKQKRMEGSVSPGLFETVDGGVHGLSGGVECTGGQYLDLLRVSDGVAGIDNFLSSFLQLSGEVLELGYLAFDKGVPQLLYGLVNDELVGVSRFEYALSKGVEGGLRTVARLSAQLDGEYGVAFTHCEVSPRTGVVEYEPHKFSLSFIVVSVVNGCRDTEPSVCPVFDERWSRVCVTCGMVNDFLVGAHYNDRRCRRSDALLQGW